MRRKPLPDADFFSREITGARRFFLNLGPAARSPLAIAAGGWEACAPDYWISRSGFPYLSIEFVAAGLGELTMDGRVHPLAAGGVYSYGPGVAHAIVSNPVEGLEKFFVNFCGRHALRMLTESGFAPGTVGAVRSAARIAAIFSELVASGASVHGRAGQGAIVALELLLLALPQERVESGDAGSARASFDRCQAYVQEHFLTLRTVADIAAACHLDAAYVCRRYQRFSGQTPYRCLVRLQMGWVAEQLLAPGSRVREVADRLGIDPFQLSRTFRRTHGVSPTEFIRLRRG